MMHGQKNITIWTSLLTFKKIIWTAVG